MQSSSNDFKGKVSVNSILLTNGKGDKVVDLSKSYAEINIFEDIFSPFMTGNILLLDSLNLVQELPIVGEELIEIDFSTIGDTEDTFRRQFQIQSLENRKIEGEQSESFVLQFISTGYYDAISTVISKSYQNEKLDSIVQKVVGEVTQMASLGVNVDDTFDTQNFIIPRLNAIRAIELLRKRTLNTNQVSDFVFFETREQFEFRSLSKLFEQDFTKPLYYLPNTGISFKNYPKDLGISSEFDFVVKSEQIKTQIDNGQNIVDGMYGNRLISFDPIKKLYTETDHNLSSNRDSFGRLDRGNFFTNDFASQFGERPSTKTMLHVTGSNDNVEKWLPSKAVQRRLINNIRVEVTLDGILSFTAGETTYYARRNANPLVKNVDSAFDKFMEGKYLVSAVKHSITPESFLTDLELLRDSFKEQP